MKRDFLKRKGTAFVLAILLVLSVGIFSGTTALKANEHAAEKYEVSVLDQEIVIATPVQEVQVIVLDSEDTCDETEEPEPDALEETSENSSETN